MHGYELSDFRNGKAFICFVEKKDGRECRSARICINKKGEKLFELPDKDMFVYQYEDEDVAFVRGRNDKQAIMDNKGNFLTDFIYRSIYGGSEEGFFEVIRNGKHGHIDICGKEMVPCIYDDGSYFSEGIAAECLNGKWGMVDYFNNTAIPFEYEEIFICKNNVISAKKNGKYGLINKYNEIIIDFQYDEIANWTTRECLAYPAQKGGKCGIIDRYGNIIEDFIYDDFQLILDNQDNAGEFVILQKCNKKALYSTKRKEFLTDFIYDYIGDLSEGRFSVYKDNKKGFIDTIGNIVLPCIYDDSAHFEEYNEGVCAVLKDGKYGMINLEGNVVVPFKYHKLGYCNEGLILATDFDGNNGYIDKKGNIIIPFGKYISYSGFHCGFAIVWNEQGVFYIDRTGKVLDIKLNEV